MYIGPSLLDRNPWRPPCSGLLLRVKYALGLVDHLFDLLFGLADLLLGLTGLTVSLTLRLEILASGQVSDGLFGLALHLISLPSHNLPPSSSNSVPDLARPHFAVWPRRPRPVRAEGPHSQESSA